MNVGRPLEYDPAEALDAAMQAFWRRGYEGTSMQDLLDATGLSKSSFYQAFSGKHQAFQHALAHYCDNVTAGLRDRLDGADSGWSFIEGVLLDAADEARMSGDPRGCMIVNVATEFSTRDPRIRDLIADGAKRVTQVFILAVKQAQAEGDIPVARDPHVLGRYLLSSLSGIRTMVKAGTRHRAIAEIVAVIMSALK